MPKVWENGEWIEADPDYADNIYISSTAPTNVSIGALWYDTSVSPNEFKIWNGTSWNLTTTFPSADDDQYILANQVFR